MKVLFACGGSGGHVNPAIAMAQIMKRNYKDASCIFSGRPNSIEERIIQKEGYPFFPIRIEGFRRKLSCRNFKSAFLALSAPSHAKKILEETKADLVVGTGGFVSYPYIRAAHTLKIPSLLFEANAIPGLCFKVCEKNASRTLLQFEECLSKVNYPEKARVIGAPLREGFYRATREEARKALRIPSDKFFFLSFGGSLGAAEINRTCIAVTEELEKHGVLHLHGCGQRYYEEIKKKYPNEIKGGRILPYIENMSLYMCAADLILCRCGAITLAELARLGRAAILVPSPNVSRDHQRKNAYAYQRAGAALVCEERELNEASLLKTVLSLSCAPKDVLSLEAAVKRFDIPSTPKLFMNTVEALLFP